MSHEDLESRVLAVERELRGIGGAQRGHLCHELLSSIYRLPAAGLAAAHAHLTASASAPSGLQILRGHH
jgi:hypothetical protein